MSETDGNAQEPVVGQTAGVAQGEQLETPAGELQEQPAQTEQEPQVFTREDAKALKKEILNEARSYSDKGRVKLKQQLDAVEQTIKNAERFGKPFTDDEKALLRQNAQVAALKDDPTDEETAAAASAQMREVEQYFGENKLYAHDMKMQGKYGVELGTEDPEIKSFRLTGDPQTDAENIEAMYRAKAARLSGKEEQSNNQEAPTNAAVRVPSGGGTAPVKKRTAKQKLSEGLRGNWTQQAPTKGGA